MMSGNKLAAFGGPGWSPRIADSRSEIGSIWSPCGINLEWTTLKEVLLHRPGVEMEGITDPNLLQMRDIPDPDRMRTQHAGLASAYMKHGVNVVYVDPAEIPPPNLLFVADLLFMTPEGAIVGRPASTVRAGEERYIAARLAALGIPVLKTVHGNGTFEGADAMWVDEKTVFVATGLRTNAEGVSQVRNILEEMGVEVIQVQLPREAMHLMGTYRVVDRNLVFAWEGRVPSPVVDYLMEREVMVHLMPDTDELAHGFALNFVTLGPRSILMPAGNEKSQQFLSDRGVVCHTIDVSELQKACGSIGCMTGVLRRAI